MLLPLPYGANVGDFPDIFPNNESYSETLDLADIP